MLELELRFLKRRWRKDGKMLELKLIGEWKWKWKVCELNWRRLKIVEGWRFEGELLIDSY